MKKIKSSDKIRKIVFVLSLIVFIVSLGILIKLCFVDTYVNDSTMNEIKKVYYESDNENNKPMDLTSLHNINADIKGWIKIKDSKIDYPVLQSGTKFPEYYLYRNYKKEYTGFGSIFLDSLCSIEKPSKNLILYGHHMRDSSMFGDLLRYNDLNYYKARPTITFDTVIEKGEWKIISIFKTNTLKEQGEIFNYLIIDFKNDKEFLKFIDDVTARSLINIPVDTNKDDRLITLSTCSYEMKDFRTVVVARKVRDNESNEVNVELASINENPLMPTGYYKK